MKTSDLISRIEDFAPPSLASQWDNSGWQIQLEDNETNKVMIVLTPSIDVVNQAIQNDCQFILSHHPLMFSKTNTISENNVIHKAIIKAIQNNIAIYCAHTNLDRTQNGVSDYAAKALGLNNIFEFEEFVKIGEFDESKTLEETINLVKKTFGCKALKLTNPSNLQQIKKVAIGPGSCGEFVPMLKNIDLYITGDVKYHTALEVENFALIDAGHYETEKIYLNELKKLIESFGLEAIIANESEPWDFV